MAKKSMSAFEKKDAAKDKKMGIKENSPKDVKIDSAAMKKKKNKPKTASVMPIVAKIMGRGLGK